jgi:replicative DNA helicase
MCDEMRFHFCGRRLDIDGIKSWARRAKARHDIRLLVVDYLQRVGVPPRLQKAPRQEQVSYVSSELKSLALELSMVIWCPVQLNKEGDVRESAAIEFDADISIQIVLDEDAKENGAIVFNKVRQAARAKNLPIRMKGWVQTIEERKEEVGHGEAI